MKLFLVLLMESWDKVKTSIHARCSESRIRRFLGSNIDIISSDDVDLNFNLDFKRKIWTLTGIRTSDLQITSLALLPIELSKFPFQTFLSKR